MSNIILAFPNRTDTGTLSGGSWQSGAPLPNLQDIRYKLAARSVDLFTSHTQYQIDLGKEILVLVVAEAAHNYTTAATRRVTGSNVSDFSTLVFDSGWLPAYPVMPTLLMSWSDSTWWSGLMDPERKSYYPDNSITVINPKVRGRYWKVEISDPTNPAGYISIGRAFFCDGWQPRYNTVYSGASSSGSQGTTSLLHETNTVSATSLGDTMYFDERPVGRVMQVALDYLSDAEAFGAAMDIERRQSVVREVFFILDPSNPALLIQTAFPARLRNLTEIDFPSYNVYTKAYEMREITA